jgi:wobble nucleotide-excising tRNase
VYNQEFLQSVFSEDGSVKGVFTLGIEDNDIKGRIKELTEAVSEEQRQEQQLTATLQGDDGKGGKRAEMSAATKKLKDACLVQTRKHKGAFKFALKGVMGDSEVFRVRLLQERSGNDGVTCSFDDLMARARTVFSDAPEVVSPLPSTSSGELKALESDPIFKKVIVGKVEANLAGLINLLKNSDWVAQGATLFQECKPKCPFCQQVTPATLEQDLADFFDGAFAADVSHLERLVESYTSEMDRIVEVMNLLGSASTDYHDKDELGRLIEVFDARRDTALLTMQRKLELPSMVAELGDVASALDEVVAFVTAANLRIGEHNLLVSRASTERASLTADFWRYLLDVELKSDLDRWDSSDRSIGRAIESLEAKVAASRATQRQLKAELQGLEEKVTSTRPTVDRINETLRAFHFTGFRLEPVQDVHSYRLVRANGMTAHHSLSEGERTLVAFLYFYHLSQAADSSTGIEEDRIVVLDDPISSLDSDIMFVVSSLVREMVDMARSGKGPIKQIIVLTHNVYFHKEVTFAKGGGGLPASAFWVCRKRDGTTSFVAHKNVNPVKSSYQLLWQEIRKPEGNSLTLPNTMRRIFESYFKLLGGFDVDKACEGFVANEKLAARALLSWANDGSHAVHDDLYMIPDECADALYMSVFRRVFENLHQGDHYRMMMGDDFKDGPEHKDIEVK